MAQRCGISNYGEILWNMVAEIRVDMLGVLWRSQLGLRDYDFTLHPAKSLIWYGQAYNSSISAGWTKVTVAKECDHPGWKTAESCGPFDGRTFL